MSRDLKLLSLSLTLWGVGEGMFFLFQPLYLEQLGANPVEIGGILGMVYLTMGLTHLPAGFIADRFGRRQVMWASWLIGVLATGLMALAPSLPLFVAGMLAYGATAFVSAPLASYVTAARGNWQTGRALTTISATFNLGGVLGPLIGGWIGAQFGLRQTFGVAFFLFVLSTALVLLLQPQPVQANHEHHRAQNLRLALLSAPMLRFLGLTFVGMLALYLPLPLTQNFLQNERALSLDQIGMAASASGLGVVVFNLTLGRMNALRAFYLIPVVLAGFSLLIWLGSGLPWYLAAYLLMGSFKTARSLLTAQERTLIAEEYMGLAYGLFETVASAALIASSALSGWLYAVKPDVIYPVSLPLLALTLLLFWWFNPVRAEAIK
ncbi:MAG: tetracycline resistance MFS efflux pump [Anaerolineales bacterium]